MWLIHSVLVVLLDEAVVERGGMFFKTKKGHLMLLKAPAESGMELHFRRSMCITVPKVQTTA
ncbi:hypothetical protein EYF80_006671 [Liparis tanakae]|uniref:Uncharacterized protein n=1 Tax=Liparis tanakae TaxID=230148 RepID=A0A4Z2IZR7_9TELE|nr:hypothetical protein EYF80_006671 [Liparis tanakae]